MSPGNDVRHAGQDDLRKVFPESLWLSAAVFWVDWLLGLKKTILDGQHSPVLLRVPRALFVTHLRPPVSSGEQHS